MRSEQYVGLIWPCVLLCLYSVVHCHPVTQPIHEELDEIIGHVFPFHDDALCERRIWKGNTKHIHGTLR